jgi:hypothetical protein
MIKNLIGGLLILLLLTPIAFGATLTYIEIPTNGTTIYEQDVNYTVSISGHGENITSAILTVSGTNYTAIYNNASAYYYLESDTTTGNIQYRWYVNDNGTWDESGIYTINRGRLTGIFVILGEIPTMLTSVLELIIFIGIIIIVLVVVGWLKGWFKDLGKTIRFKL